jgi:transketolase
LGRASTPRITTDESPFVLGKAQTLWSSEHSAEVVVFVTGPLAHHALVAAKELERRVPVEVINIHTIKPLDIEAVVAAARAAGAVVTVEEHQLAGGMGSTIAEALAQACPVPHEFVAVRDHFGQSGEPGELIEHYGLGKDGIMKAIEQARRRKIVQ